MDIDINPIFWTCPFAKIHVVIFCVCWSTIGQYWSIFVRTYLLYGTASLLPRLTVVPALAVLAVITVPLGVSGCGARPAEAGTHTDGPGGRGLGRGCCKGSGGGVAGRPHRDPVYSYRQSI